MKEGCRTSWILQDRTTELYACDVALSFTKRKAIQRLSGLALLSWAHWSGWLLLSFKGWGYLSGFCDPACPHPVSQGEVTLQRHWGYCALPMDPEDSALNQKGLLWSLKIRWNLPCNFLGLLETCHPFLLSYCSLLKWECLSCHCILEALNLPGFTGS